MTRASRRISRWLLGSRGAGVAVCGGVFVSPLQGWAKAGRVPGALPQANVFCPFRALLLLGLSPLDTSAEGP